jgi:hypothetical protein
MKTPWQDDMLAGVHCFGALAGPEVKKQKQVSGAGNGI